jgi:hypothetical protein
MTRRASGILTPQIPLHPCLAPEVREQLPSGTTTSLFAHRELNSEYAGFEVCEICEYSRGDFTRRDMILMNQIGLGIVPSELGPGAKVLPPP